MKAISRQGSRPGVVLDSIEDFSGGLNTREAPNRLQPNEAAACGNVWYDTGALKKRPGYTAATITIGASSATSSLNPKEWVRASNSTRYLIVAHNAMGFQSLAYTTNYSTFTPVAYSTGTVTTTNGSPTVTGSGTTWSSLAVPNATSAMFIVQSDLGTVTARFISSVNSDTSITLAANYGASNGPGATYWIFPFTANAAYESMNGYLYAATPGTNNSAIKTDLTGFACVSAFPRVQFISAFKNYMFAANDGSNYSRVYWSALKDPDTWPAANFVDVNPDDGDVITGLVNDGQALLILKQRSIWKLSGDVFDPSNPTYSLTRMFTPPQARWTMSRSMQLFGKGYVLHGGDGLYLYTGGQSVERIPASDKIQSEFDLINAPTAVQSVIANAAIEWKGRFLMQVATAGNGATNRGYYFDKNGGFWPITKTVSGDTGLFGQVEVSNKVLYGANAGKLYTLDTGSSDEGNAINGTYTTKVFEYESFQSFGRLWVDFKKQAAGNLTVEYSVDEGSFASATVDMTTGTGTRVKSQEILIGRVGRSIQFRLSNNVAAQDFEVYALTWERKRLRN